MDYAKLTNYYELYHHGILGMKWGVRRYQNEDGTLTDAGRKRYGAEKNYERTKADAKLAKKKYNKAASRAYGINKIQALKPLEKNMHKTELKSIDAKAKYNASKKIGDKKADKAEMRTYRRAMQKTGIRGSYLDVSNRNRSTRIYNHLTATKGKEYADRVEKKVQNTAYAKVAGSLAVSAGASIAALYMAYKY